MNNEQKRTAILNEAKKFEWSSDFELIEKHLKAKYKWTFL